MKKADRLLVKRVRKHMEVFRRLVNAFASADPGSYP